MRIRRVSAGAAKLLCLIGLAIALASFDAGHIAHAEAGQAFSITRPVIELQADPGQTVNATIKFTNISGGDLVITTQFNDFGAKDETGEPNILFDDAQSTSYTLRHWIATLPQFRIASKEARTLTFPITVPRDAEPGGHYAVIRFTGTAPEQSQTGVSQAASIGTLILLQVAGDIKEEASLMEFSPANVTVHTNSEPTYTNTSFFEYAPVSFVERIKNTGNVHVKPTGTIDIFNVFGSKVSSIRVNGDPTDPKNPPKSALPQSIRRFGQTGPEGWMLGYYTAKINLSYGQSQKQLTQTVGFWVIPYKLIAIVIILSTGLFFLGRSAIRRYNEHIIAKASGKPSSSKSNKRKK
jgi:hypothetical protein